MGVFITRTLVVVTLVAMVSLLVLWTGTLLLGGLFGSLNPFRSEPVLNTGPTVVHSIRELSDLVTVEMVEYTTIEQGRDAGILDFARGDRIFLFAVARIGAGVDLGEIREDDIDVNDESGTVVVRLPEPTILYAALDTEHTQVYDRDTGILTRGDRDLETEARQTAEALLREQAVTSGILDRATENAKETLTVFLEGLGFEDVIIRGAFDEDLR